MRVIIIKVVPDAEPNADGRWITRRVPNRYCWGGISPSYHLLDRDHVPSGEHCVQWMWHPGYRGPRR